MYLSINPANAEKVWVCDVWDAEHLERVLAKTASATPAWGATPVAERCRFLRRTAEVLREQKEELARLITTEMGKLSGEARAEVDKCALACDFYAEHSPVLLTDELIPSDAGKSLVAYQPLGTVLAIMPWNFPLWQVFRFAAPALASGNTALLKHASNVPQCAMAIERVFANAGLPHGVFHTLLISAAQTEQLIADPRIHAVTLTGSEPAGRRVAASAGAHLKKTVLELGGSDPFIVLSDADLDLTVHNAVLSRFQNAGQSCIAAKRFIVVDQIAESFLERFKREVEALNAGDPGDTTTTLAPMARGDLRDELHKQVSESIERGAIAVSGCGFLPGAGYFYAASILDRVAPGMPAYEQELFGPVAAVIRVRDDADALTVANASRFGLGGSVWTQDTARGERIARQVQSGACFVNGMVKSDPRLPFGGVKASGYGRELSYHGLREFVNAKTIWIR